MKSRMSQIRSLSKRITYIDIGNLTIAMTGVLTAQADADVFVLFTV